MALTPVDRALLQRCLQHSPGSWNDFVDRYLGLIYHAIHYTSHLRSLPLGPEDVEDVAAEVLLQLVADDYKVLRQFRGNCSLATYLTVIARRICLHELTRRLSIRTEAVHAAEREERPRTQAGLENLEQVQKLLSKLRRPEREVVRMFYLEGRSYEEISTKLNIPVNSIGPVLSRARKKLREDARAAPRPKVPQPAPAQPQAQTSESPPAQG